MSGRPIKRTLRHRGPGHAPGDAQKTPEGQGLAAESRDSYAVRNAAILRVMFELALRVSEVVRLDVEDLELDHGALVGGQGKAEPSKRCSAC